jgi:uncharacterized damage-inducible protein DinB
MAELSASDTVRTLYAYHWWANRKLFDVAAALGEEAASREVGKQFSLPTLRGMFGHLYAADWGWLSRWKGTSPTKFPEPPATMAELRHRWDALEREQRAFLDGLTPADLARELDYKNTAGTALRLPLSALLHHVATHAVHHRSEIATMITMISQSPPDTSMHTYHLTLTGQVR